MPTRETVTASRFLDDLARTLAEPMPRRRALRIITASVAALATPGMAPRNGFASSALEICPPASGRRQCHTSPDWVPGRPDPVPYCCPFPEEQWGCGDEDNGYTCVNHCPPYNPASKSRQKPTWGEKLPNGRRPYNCCPVPDNIPRDGECVPNCPYLYTVKRNGLVRGPKQCGKNCCLSYERCEDGECKPCNTNTCQPAVKGEPKCCPKGTECCANRTTTACCGEKQTCKAAGRKVATCACPSGTKKCGPECCAKGESCLGGDTCCKPQDKCGGGCCAEGETCCGSLGCCGPDEWCFHKNTGTIFTVPTCKPTCQPGNRCGRNCCGTGYSCVNGRCVQ